jgi:hypothetical protein
MWLIAEYQPVTLFSLKSGLATSTGAKTLFVPTPFAIRMALLDAAIRTQGMAIAPSTFAALKGATLAIRPPAQVAVTNLFARIQKPARSDAKAGGKQEEEAQTDEGGAGKAMMRTIAFREYAYLLGNLGIAFTGRPEVLSVIRELLPQVNYFGKRGGFFQLLDVPGETADLPADYCLLEGACLPGTGSGSLPATFPLGVIQVLDDWGPTLTFAKANIYEDDREGKIELGKDRIRRSVVLPYRLSRSSRSFTLYERFAW